MEKLYINTENRKDIVTLEEIKKRYVDINETDNGFEEYVKSGFLNGITVEYVELQTNFQEIGKAILRRHIELLKENREDWNCGKYSTNKALEDAIKEVCLLEPNGSYY